MRAHAPSAPSLRLLMPAVGHRYTSRAMSLTFARIAMASRRCVEVRGAHLHARTPLLLFVILLAPRAVQRRDSAQLGDKVAHARDGLKDRSGRHSCARAHRDRVGTSCRRYLRREEQAARTSRGGKERSWRHAEPGRERESGALPTTEFGCVRDENRKAHQTPQRKLLLDKRKPWSMLGCVVCYLSPSLAGWGLT